MPRIGEHVAYGDDGSVHKQITSIWYNFGAEENVVITFDVDEPFTLA